MPETMIHRGRVTASSLNMRDRPSGDIIRTLPLNTAVEIVEDNGDWFKVKYDNDVGFVSKKYISEDLLEESILSPPTDNTRFRYVNKSAIAPDGVTFGTKFRKGVYHYGDTSIADYVEKNRSRFPAELNSCLNVMMAASENEGKYEAINTWDNSFLSFGIFQWTCGTTSATGELPALLGRIEKACPDIFHEFFGQYGLSIKKTNARKGAIERGYFKLDGILLNNSPAKNKLRTLPWAYRFWSAGYDDTIREIETLHAIDRINTFYRQERQKIGNFFVADYINSEYGVSLLLDQHVNRPGHVPKILANAVKQLKDELDIENPQSWGDKEEATLIEKYLELREKTSMTHSGKRAKTIHAKIAEGLVSNNRHSFIER